MELTPKGFEKASDKLTKEQLDTPVDEYTEPKPEEAPVEKTEESKDEAGETVTPESVTEPVIEEEEKRVPFSRFKKVFDDKTEAERRLRELESQHSNEGIARASESYEGDLPDYWTRLFGDSEASREAYQAELERLAQLEEKAAERAIERLKEKEIEATKKEQEVVSAFNDQFDLLTAELGKNLSDDEKAKVLDVVEEYSPKDGEGRLIRDYLIPVSKAYEIYQLQEEAKTATRKKERSKAVELTSARTEGSPSTETSSEFIPGRTRQWESKLPT